MICKRLLSEKVVIYIWDLAKTYQTESVSEALRVFLFRLYNILTGLHLCYVLSSYSQLGDGLVVFASSSSVEFDPVKL